MIKKTKSQIKKFWTNKNHLEYTESMGGSVDFGANGLNSTNSEIWKYYSQLREYYCGKFLWQSDILDSEELNLIEWFLFHRGSCVVLRPSHPTKIRDFELYEELPKIFEFASVRQNTRTLQPFRINIVNSIQQDIIQIPRLQYKSNEFAIITCNQNNANGYPTPHAIAWEYACKIHELDLAFNANSHKQRLPLLFNNGKTQTESGTQLYQLQGSITDVVRSAVNQNQQFVEISEDKVGERGLLHQTNQYAENNLKDYLECKRQLVDDYLETVGVNILREQGGVYQAEDVQTTGMDSTKYKMNVALNNRLKGLNKTNQMFNLDLRIEVL